MKKNNKSILGIILSISLLCTVGFCIFLGVLVYHDINWSGEELYDERRCYTFDANNIMDDILHGIEPTFQEIEDIDAYDWDTHNSQVINYTEAEYMQIAELFFASYLQDDLNTWYLKHITYRILDCETGMLGEVGTAYTVDRYFPEEKHRVEREISISPRQESICIREQAEISPIVKLGIYPEDFNYNATQALEIAEKTGGKEARQLSQECNAIVVDLFAGRPEWVFHYYFSDIPKETFVVDVQTGEMYQRTK